MCMYDVSLCPPTPQPLSVPPPVAEKVKTSPWWDHDKILDTQQSFEDDEKILMAPNLGPIGPPSKVQKPPGSASGMKTVPSMAPGPRNEPPGGVRGDPESRFSPVMRSHSSPSSGINSSPQRNSNPSPVAKSPLLGAAPPGGLLPTPEKC